jgi:Zn-dependent protease
VAYRCGDDTAKLSGRVTLSPLAHLDPLGTLMFIFSSLSGIGFGWAKPVPVNPLRFRNWRRDDILVSLAGVAMNLVQALVWTALFHASKNIAGTLGESLTIFCFIGIVMNISLMIFNLLPIPPLDGSHIAFNLLGIRDPVKVYQWSRLGSLLLFLFVSSGFFSTVFRFAVEPILRLLIGY